jgi:shikimate kinase
MEQSMRATVVHMFGGRSVPEEVSIRLVAAVAPIIILGMTAVGKTTTGRLLAGLAGLEFVDSDQAIECQTGRTCADIKINSGESTFRELEESVVLSLLDRRDCVVALGGGAWMQFSVREKAQRVGTTVWLRAAEEVIRARIRAAGRVTALNPDGSDRVSAMLAARRHFYTQAMVHVMLAGESPDEAARTVIDEIACTISQAADH